MGGPARELYRKRGGSRAVSATASDPAPRRMARAVTVAVDAMGADGDPRELIAGVALAAKANPAARYLAFGDPEVLTPAASAHGVLTGRIDVRAAERVVSMDDKPGDVLRRADGTSMAGAIDAVAAGEAEAAVSCGNTGALMALASLRLGRIEGVARPAIAALWPSIEPGRQTVVLDVGADVRMEPRNLCQFAVMGAVFAEIGLGLERPRVGLLNIGSEAHKGRTSLQETAEMIARAARARGFDYHGFVEANEIPMDVVDVAVTDGFTGNVALKAAEGTAKLVRSMMKTSMTASPIARLGAVLAKGAFKEMSRNMDPRRVNGGILLGLNGSIVKSHGDADALGFSVAVGLAERIGAGRLPSLLADQLVFDAAA